VRADTIRPLRVGAAESHQLGSGREAAGNGRLHRAARRTDRVLTAAIAESSVENDIVEKEVSARRFVQAAKLTSADCGASDVGPSDLKSKCNENQRRKIIESEFEYTRAHHTSK
jgi:hypothetical protein